jgi:hypothetical protein
MTRALFIAATAFALLTTTPAMSQTKKQQAHESSGEAASQVQRGGLKRDRKITHHIRQRESRSSHAQASYSGH